MAVSNHRITAPETVHHLVSRTAHRVYLMEESERSDFLELVRRTTEFSGLTLIGWCVMTNHFHLLVYLPTPVVPDEKEVVRRFGVLKGRSAAAELSMRLKALRSRGEEGEKEAEATLNRIRRRMYRIDEYMRIIKQWFSEEYNARTGHKGTMWESAYHDKVVPREYNDLRRTLGYIHLNPVKAAITDGFDDYAWSSFTAFRRGDALARKGMRFVYRGRMSAEAMAESHTLLLESMLNDEKRDRAQKIARLRLSGCAAPCDPLTNEAMVVQAMEQMKVVRRATVELHEEREAASNKLLAMDVAERQILELLKANGPMTTVSIAKSLGISERTVRRYLASMAKSGKVVHEHRFAPWRIA